LINFHKYKRIYRLPLLCIFVLISATPLYSNAKDPDSGLAAQPSHFSLSPSSLHRLLQLVVHEHPQVKSQVLAIQAAGQDVLVAQQAYWPTPSVSVEHAQSQAIDPAYAGSPQVVTLKLQQPVWTGGRLTAQRQKSLASQAVETARLVEIQQSLALKALQTWADVVSSQRQQSILRGSESTQKMLLNKMQRRVDQGLSAQSEVNYSSLRLQQVQQELRNAEHQENQAWIRLKQWAPDVQILAPDPALQSSISLPNVSHESTDSTALAIQIFKTTDRQYEQLSIEQSPMLHRLAHVSLQQQADLDEKRASLQPEVYVRAEHQRGNFAYAHLQPMNRVFVGVTATTGAGLSLAYQLAALQIKHDGTLEDSAAAERTVIEAIQADVMNANARQSKLATLQFNLESSQEMQAAWERQFINGKKTWIDVMNAARETTQAELAVVENDMSLLHSFWRLQIQAQGIQRWVAP
jgi:adhesin transport system outer membrane protein